MPEHNRTGSQRFPRVRGDVPATLGEKFTEYAFSPRARGCSLFAGL